MTGVQTCALPILGSQGLAVPFIGMASGALGRITDLYSGDAGR